MDYWEHFVCSRICYRDINIFVFWNETFPNDVRNYNKPKSAECNDIDMWS